MSTTRPLAGSLLLLLVAACGGVGGERPIACDLDETCGPGARCLAGACVANALPAADFQVPDGAATHRELLLVASASDPDPEDQVVAWAWEVVPGPGACPPELGPADRPSLELIAWCPGSYEVSLVVFDALGGASPPRRRTLLVAAAELPPQAEAGAALSVDHRCDVGPARCALAPAGGGEAVQLAGAGSSAGGGAVTFEWTAVPPDEARGGASVVFSPGPSVANPTVRIETGGGPISGEWRMRLRVRDQSGQVAQAVQLLSVANRAPAPTAAVLAADHAYVGGEFLVDAAPGAPVADPDGDPMTFAAELVEAPGTCGAGVTVAGGALQVHLECPTPSGLLGRSVDLSAVDANGAVTRVRLPLEVLNRPPAVAFGTVPLLVDHSVGSCPDSTGDCFLAAGAGALEVSDPDGDPVALVGASALVAGVRPGSSGEITSVSPDLSFRFSSPVARPTDFRAADGASGFSLEVAVADAFGSRGSASSPVAIANRAPIWTPTTPTPRSSHTYSAAASEWTASAPLGTFADPDGDPLVAAATTFDLDCEGIQEGPSLVARCRRPWTIEPSGEPPLATFAGTYAFDVSVSDGWSASGGPMTMVIGNEVPAIPAFHDRAESCVCICSKVDSSTGDCVGTWRWETDPLQVTVPVHPLDADGDPLQVTFTSSASIAPTKLTALPGEHTLRISNATFPVSVGVSASDGVATASGTWVVTGATCASSGTPCEGG